MQPGKGAGQQAGRQQRVQELGLGVGGWTVGNWRDERALEQAIKRVGREPAEGVIRGAG